MPQSTVTAGEQRFVITDSGEGPLVVLLHGFPDTPFGWEDTRAALNDAGYRTVIPYLRGYHPDTIVPGRSYGGPEIGQDALRLLDALDAREAVFVGHDWGAAIAYRAAVLEPARVRGVCGVAIPHPRLLERSPAMLWRGRHFISLRLPSGPALTRWRDFAYVDTLMRRWAPNWSGPARQETLAAVKRAFADPRVLDGALRYYRDVSLGEGLARISTPALVFGGTTDLIAPEVFQRSPEAFDAPCEVVIAEGAGHWPHREATALFNERLIGFLSWLPAAGAAGA